MNASTDTHTQNLHAFTVKFHGPTNYKGARVAIIDERSGWTFDRTNERQARLTFSYDYRIGNTLAQAVAWFHERGVNVIGTAETRDTYLILTDDFRDLSELANLPA